jgi:DNA-binding NtrC family response regulator
MENQRPEEATNVVTFGKRKIRPRVCVADGKRHTRTFLVEILEELGFLPCECTQARELGTVLDAQVPDLVVLGLSAGGIEACEILKMLAARAFGGKALLLGPRDPRVVAAVQEFGEGLGIAMLPALNTPSTGAAR